MRFGFKKKYRFERRLQGAVRAATAFASRASSQICAFVLTVIAARFLSPAEFGIFAIATIATTLIRTLLYAGAFEYLLKTEDLEGSATECMLVGFFLALMLSLPIIFFLELPREGFINPELAFFILALLPSNFLSVFAAWQESMILRSKRVNYYYAVIAIAEIISTVVSIILLNYDYKIYALIAKIYTSTAIMIVLYTGAIGITHIKKPSISKIKEITGWSLPRYTYSLISFGSNYSADVILGFFLSPTATGLYRGSNRIVTAASDLFNQPTRTISMTYFSDRASRSLPSYGLWPLVLSLAGLVMWPAMIGLAIASPILVPYVLGPQWADAVPIVVILCAAQALSLVGSVISPLLVATDRSRSLLRAQFITTPIFIAGATIAVQFNVELVAAAVVINSLMNVTAVLFFVRRHTEGVISFGIPRLRLALLVILPCVSTAIGAALPIYFQWFVNELPLLFSIFLTGVAFCILGLVIVRKTLINVVHVLTSH